MKCLVFYELRVLSASIAQSKNNQLVINCDSHAVKLVIARTHCCFLFHRVTETFENNPSNEKIIPKLHDAIDSFT